MPHISEEHPRFISLNIREALVKGFQTGLVAEAGLMAHGRGEALDYLIGEESRTFALNAEKAGVAALLMATHPVISINGNTAALVASEIVQLANIIKAKIEINLFHRSDERATRIHEHLINNGAKAEDILVLGDIPETELPEIASSRRIVAEEGIAQADCILVPLEDGDRTEALKKLNKIVIAIDLNPLSRTAQQASITIVDNIVRAIPKMIEFGEKLAKWPPDEQKQVVESYENRKILKSAISAIEARLVALADLDEVLQ